MLNLSVNEMLALWSDLNDAMFGVNKFGGSVAELYMYRFGFSLSEPHPIEQYRRKDVREANASLYALLAHFAEHRAVSIKVEGRDLGEWVKDAGFEHRVHVEVGKPAWLERRAVARSFGDSCALRPNKYFPRHWRAKRKQGS